MLKQSFLLCYLEWLCWAFFSLQVTSEACLVLAAVRVDCHREGIHDLDGAEQYKTSLGREDLSWDEWLAHWDSTICCPPCFSPNVSNIFEKMEDVFHWSVLNVGCSSFTKVTQSCFDLLWAALVLSEHAVTWSRILDFLKAKPESSHLAII